MIKAVSLNIFFFQMKALIEINNLLVTFYKLFILVQKGGQRKDAMLWDREAAQYKQNAAVITWLTSLFYSTMVIILR